MARHLAASIEDQHGRVVARRRRDQPGGRGMRHVVRDEAHLPRVQPGQRGGEELRGTPGVVDA
jgi:hypothetical protein